MLRAGLMLSIIFSGSLYAAESDNLLRLGTDTRFIYRRQLAQGWWLGTDVKGVTSGGGDSETPFSTNQVFSYWLATLTKDLEWRGFHMCNTVKYLGSEKRFTQFNFNLQFNKAVPLAENVRFNPTFTALDYVFDSDPGRETFPWQRAHNFSTLWGLSLEFDYFF